MQARDLTLEERKEPNGEIFYWRGVIFETLGQIEKAEACWREAIRLMPGWATLYNRLVILMSRRKAPFSEILALEVKAIELEPTNFEYHNNLGYIYLLQGQHADALRELQKAITLNPSYGLAYYNIGLTRYATGQYKESWAALLKARDLRYTGDHAFVMKVEQLAKVPVQSTTNVITIGPLR